MKKSSNRSQRGSKGIKGKHVLQICVLLGVCIWLIYQVKYSHDKKKEFYEKDGEKSTVLLSEREDGLVKLGRKDLLPGYHNNKNENEKEKQVEEEEDEEDEKEGKSKVEEEKEEEEEVVEEDEEDKNKQGEEVAEDDEDESKHEEDEIDEQDQSKSEGDNDKEDELLEEEKESDEKEKESSHVDEIDMTVHEAREEHYKADDASSAVSHESRVLSTEKLKDSPENSTEVAQEKNSNATTSKVEMQKELGLKLGEVVSGYVVKNATTEVKDGDSQSSDSDTRNAVTEARGETVSGNSTEAILEASGFLQNETEIMQDRSREDGAPPVGFSNLQTVFNLEQIHNQSNSNITVPANVTGKDSIQDESRNSTSESSLTGNISASNSTDAKDNSTSESSLIENISASNTTEEKESSRSEGDDESAEKESSNLNSTDQTEEADDTPERSITEEETEADDTRERSISDEEREALIDPQTLPDIRVEGNEEDEDEAIGAE